MNQNKLSHKNLPRLDRFGFTLVELLVVIAIIGVLVALLLPAVQAAREAARRSSCQNNFKQQGLALALYEEARGEYPAGAIWGGGPRNHRGSLMIFMLPYIEQQAVYDLFDFTMNTDDQLNPNTMEPIGNLPIETYKCPSDEHPDDLDHDRAMSNYAGLKGSSRHINNSGCSCRTFNTWNSFALSPYESFQTANDYAGVFTRIGIVTKQEHITDGISQTAYMGETVPECSAHASNGWAMSNNGQGLTSTIVPINFDSCIRERSREGCNRHCNWNTELGVKSRHPGGAHLLYGDGSIQFLSESIDMWTYQYIGAKADGEVITPE